MQIELNEIPVSKIVEEYKDDGEGGVVGYGGKLDIRPKYQREFIYNNKQRDAVIHTITKNFPLNVMYWAIRDDGGYEIIDGQQRTVSIARYVAGDFSFDGLYFHNLPSDKKKQILDYELMIYVCSGTDSEKLEWFKIINIAGEELSNQELRNAVYAGSWVTDAKRYFSRSGCVAYQIGKSYLKGQSIRQHYLETVIKWISNNQIEDYMGKHQTELSAEPLWDYFLSVISWIKETFKTYRKPMKGVDWGTLYNSYKDEKLDPGRIEEETAKLLQDEDVTNQSGIYPYILTRKEKYLNIRAFPEPVQQRVYEKQSRKCNICMKGFDFSEMEADHIVPWIEGGKTIEDNCQMLCKKDHQKKSAKG